MNSGLPASSPSLSLAEQFASFAEYAASTVDAPRPASTSLDVARFHAFTGEISFSTDPTVRLYLDGGSVYHAERDGDPSMSQMLRDLGVAEADQLERGLVRVGDVEHLGRLFDREPSIDRDAVMVVVETRTEAIVRELANRTVSSVSVSAYRHHPSGIHRWFVAPADPIGSQRPVSAVAQVDRSVVDELPELEATSPDIEIEWSDPDPSGPSPAPRSTIGAADQDILAELDGFDADQADWASHDDEPAAVAPLSQFHIVWPDGTADQMIGDDADDGVPESDDAPPVADLAPPAPTAMTPAPLAPPLPADAAATPPAPTAEPPADAAEPTSEPLPAPTPESDELATPPSFSIAPLQVDELPEPDAAVPDDVAAAVKRALQAIEGASTGHASVPELPVAPISLPELHLPVEADPGPDTAVTSAPATPPAPTDEARPAPPVRSAPTPDESPVTAPAPPAPLGFAPPTPEMRAEVIYERAVAAAQTTEASPSDATAASAAPRDPGSDPEASGHERRGALRRLIDSLRHKDD